MKLVTGGRMRAIDRAAVGMGVPEDALMEEAGRAIARVLMADLPEERSACIVCGHGNNGGDGLVVARVLHDHGWRVEVLRASEKDFEGTAKLMLSRLPRPVRVRSHAQIPELLSHLESFDAVVDCILGTGARGVPAPPLDMVIQVMNLAKVYRVAADLPSGLDADTGAATVAVHAHRTVAIGLPKIGMIRGRGPELCGAIAVEPIQFPASLLAAADVRQETLLPDEAAALLPPRPADGNKGTFGCVAVVAGSAETPGASILAAIGALRSGTGLVRCLVPASARPLMIAAAPEVVLHAGSAGLGDGLGPLDKDGWDRLLQKTTAVVVGPGLGTAQGARDLVFQVLERVPAPVVLDADALNILAEETAMRELVDVQHILTPHPGELARLLRRPVAEIQGDRWAAAADAADSLGAVVVLKGRGTLVARPGGAVTHIPTGNTALARGGSGDLLAGLIGGLAAQGMRPADAACLGAWVHGLAADIATRSGSPRGLTVSDIAGILPLAFRETERRLTGVAAMPPSHMTDAPPGAWPET